MNTDVIGQASFSFSRRMPEDTGICTSNHNRSDKATNDMNKITAGLLNTTFSDESASSHEVAFRKIVIFVGGIRGGKIPSDEPTLTSALAKPFRPGRLLVLLMEPRRSYPRFRGAQDGISSCASLQAID